MKFGSLTVSSERSKRSASNAVAAHTVKKGDTLYSIAKKYGVSVEQIAKANNIKDNKIAIGAILTIPLKTVEKPKKLTYLAMELSKKPHRFQIKKLLTKMYLLPLHCIKVQEFIMLKQAILLRR